MKGNEHSSEIKTELLEITEAFGLGSFIGITYMEPDTKLLQYIFTQFETSMGSYNHYWRIKP